LNYMMKNKWAHQLPISLQQCCSSGPSPWRTTTEKHRQLPTTLQACSLSLARCLRCPSMI
jgi:hypothetical protein